MHAVVEAALEAIAVDERDEERQVLLLAGVGGVIRRKWRVRQESSWPRMR